jgi:hypothetical protein
MFLDIPGFIDKGPNDQRLYYQPFGALFETIIDITPFGKLETAERTIAWPPDANVVMNVAAFSDVCSKTRCAYRFVQASSFLLLLYLDSWSSNSLLGLIGMTGETSKISED